MCNKMYVECSQRLPPPRSIVCVYGCVYRGFQSSCLHHLGATTSFNDFLRRGPFRPEDDCPIGRNVVLLVFSSWGTTRRPVKEDVITFEDSWVVQGFQQGLVFWSKAEGRLVESEVFGEASKQGEIGRGTTELEERSRINSIFFLILLDTLVEEVVEDFLLPLFLLCECDFFRGSADSDRIRRRGQ